MKSAFENSGNIEGVLFDLDGTLADNYTAIHSCLVETFETLGLEPIPSYEKVVRTVGGSILMTIERLIGKKCAPEAGELYVRLFPKHIFNGLAPMPHALEILAALRGRGLKLACFTNKGEDSARAILEKLGMFKFLDAVVGTALYSSRKPQREFTLGALEKIGVRPESALIIGDSPFDGKSGENAGVPACLVATGGDSYEELEAECPYAAGIFPDLRALALGVWGIELVRTP